MQLVYRGQTIHGTPQRHQPTATPQALNWRYPVAAPAWHEPTLLAAPKHYQPQAINWRFESVVNG